VINAPVSPVWGYTAVYGTIETFSTGFNGSGIGLFIYALTLPARICLSGLIGGVAIAGSLASDAYGFNHNIQWLSAVPKITKEAHSIIKNQQYAAVPSFSAKIVNTVYYISLVCLRPMLYTLLITKVDREEFQNLPLKSKNIGIASKQNAPNRNYLTSTIAVALHIFALLALPHTYTPDYWLTFCLGIGLFCAGREVSTSCSRFKQGMLVEKLAWTILALNPGISHGCITARTVCSGIRALPDIFYDTYLA
jgi:hypothetical protein